MDDSVAQQVDDSPQPAASLEHREGSELLQKALALLAEEKREVLILSRYHDLKYEEIGAILGCPVGTVKARVHRALKDLKKEYVRLAGK